MNRYTRQFSAACQNNGELIIYRLMIETDVVIMVEDIVAAPGVSWLMASRFNGASIWVCSIPAAHDKRNKMFVRQSKYEAMRNRAISAEMALLGAVKEKNALLKEWNALVNRINTLGGESFMQRGESSIKANQFESEDIQRLLMLCHPDKHDGKPMATEMTAKLLKLKEALK